MEAHNDTEPIISNAGFGKSTVIAIVSTTLLVGVVSFGIGYYLADKNPQPQAINPQPQTPKDTPTPTTEGTNQSKLKGAVALNEGVVEINKKDTWVSLEKDSIVGENDTIRTGEKSRAVINLDDGSAIRLDQNTQITIGTLSNEIILIKQEKGHAYHRVNPGELLYNVKSLSTIATALGTSFTVKTDKLEEKTEVAVIESKVSLLSKTQENKTVIEQGQQAVIDKNNKVVLGKFTQTEKNKEFYAWNEGLDGVKKVPKIETPKPKPSEKIIVKTENSPFTGTLKLSASSEEIGKIKLNWSVENGESKEGFKLCIGKNENPTYKVDSCEYMDSSKREHYIKASSGETLHFRLGAYVNGSVSTYSNNVTLSVK